MIMSVNGALPPSANYNLVGRLSRIESEQSQRLFKLNLTIDQQRDEISRLSNQVMTMQTQKLAHEFEYFRKQDELLQLKEENGTLDNAIEELKGHEAALLGEIDQRFELETQKIHVAHEARLSQLKESVSKLIETAIRDAIVRDESELERAHRNVVELQSTIKAQERSLTRKLIKLKEDHSRKMVQLDQSMDVTLQSLRDDMVQIGLLEADGINEIAQLEKQQKKQTDALAVARAHFEAIDQDTRVREEKVSFLRDEIAALKQAIDHQRKLLADKKTEASKLEEEEAWFKLQHAEQDLVRRRLHNRLQELKGNIRVYCRIRPIDETKQEVGAAFEISDSSLTPDCKTQLTVSRNKFNRPRSGGHGDLKLKTLAYKFSFDHVIPPTATNGEIFDELSQLIQSSLDGYNVCVFAYGQTGSGKTWTMSHPQDGMIPLSMDKIFDTIDSLRQTGWTYTVQAQFLEIYNETIIDLLGNNASVPTKHEIKHDDVNNTTLVTNVTSVTLTSCEQANKFLAEAVRNRSTAATRLNERSSRSHSIFMLQLSGTNAQKDLRCRGTLNLIDLAGSERLASSHVVGDRLKETQAINKSLSSLGDVIHALGQDQMLELRQHIPYRNLKLTYLLKNSLGGDSKTLMFVNVSPLEINFNETINSLRFATKVNSTKIGGDKPTSALQRAHLISPTKRA